MKTFENFCREIESSPLKYIKGDCRLLHLNNGEWGGCLENDNFFTGYSPETRTISFAVGEKKLGDLSVEKRDAESISIDANDNLFMTLNIRKEGQNLIIRISCKSDFPGCNQFAEFIAYLTTKPLV